MPPTPPSVLLWGACIANPGPACGGGPTPSADCGIHPSPLSAHHRRGSHFVGSRAFGLGASSPGGDAARAERRLTAGLPFAGKRCYTRSGLRRGARVAKGQTVNPVGLRLRWFESSLLRQATSGQTG